MKQSLFMLMAFLCAYLSMMAFCMAMPRHFKTVFARTSTLTEQRVLYWGGWGLAALSLGASIWAWGGIIGPFACLGVVTACLFSFVFLFSYRAKAAVQAAKYLLLVLLISFISSLFV